jgi:hypothetical protein
MAEITAMSVIRSVITDVTDRRRMGYGIRACQERERDFSSKLEMELAGIAMVPEARARMNDALTEYWDSKPRLAEPGTLGREVVIGAGFHAAVYAAARVRAGFPKPLVLEQGSGEQVGGAFAVSLNPVFRLNSRSRPGKLGLPDQDRALNYLPGGLIQPSMITSEEYPTNADMAWIIRLALAQYADVCTGETTTRLGSARGNLMTVTTTTGALRDCRVLDARGAGQPEPAQLSNRTTMPTFMQLMARMGGMFPLRGMQQAAVIGGGDSARCAIESLLGLAPGHMSAIGLDYVQRVDWYTDLPVNQPTCDDFRTVQRGRYIRIAQFLEGNQSQPTVRLRVMNQRGFATPAADSVLVGDRSYDMAVNCTGGTLPALDDGGLSYFPVVAGTSEPVRRSRGGAQTMLATMATPVQSYRIGPAADLEFSVAEERAGITAIPANKIAIFRLAPRTAALAATLPGVGERSSDESSF